MLKITNELYVLTYSQMIDDLMEWSLRPVVLAGAGVFGSEDKFYKFIQMYQVPVLLTWKAMGLLPDDHPLYVGRPGAIGQVAANRIMQECDLLLVLGACMNYDQVAYQLENIARKAKKIVVDIDPVELEKYGDDWIKINAHVADIL